MHYEQKNTYDFAAFVAAFSLCSMSAFAAEGQTVYVADGGTGDGTSASSPVGTMSAAFSKLGSAGGTITLCGEVSVSAELSIPETTGDLTITAAAGGSLKIGANIALTKNTNKNVVTFDLPVTLLGSKEYCIYGNYNSITFGKNFTVTAPSGAMLSFYGGCLNGTTDGITTLPYDIVVENGTFNVFSGGNRRTSPAHNIGSIAAPISITINGGTFGKVGTYSTASNNKNYDTFSVSGMSILADDATLTITGGTFNCPIYVRGRMGAANCDASEKSTTTLSDRKYYAMDGDITVNISGGTFKGGAVSAYYTQAGYTQVLRGNYTVNISGSPVFTVKTLFDATQVKAYAGKSEKASITYPADLANIELKRFDVVNGAAQTYEEPLRVAFLGDSITEGYAAAAAGVDRLTQSYPANFLKFAETDGREVIVANYGVAGSGVCASIVRPYDKMLAWTLASEETDADYVIIAIGSNDGSIAGGTNGGLQEFEANLTKTAKTMGALPDTEKVFISSAIYRSCADFVRDLRVSAVIHPLQQRVTEKLAAEEPGKYVFVDMYGFTLPAAEDDSLFRDKNGNINERLHPTHTGLTLMGKSFYDAVFKGITVPAKDYKRTDIYISDKGSTFGAGTKEDPCSSLPVAFDKIPYGEEVTIHIVGTFTFKGNVFIPLTPSKITLVGEGSDATLVCGGDTFKLGTNTKIDNLTLRSTHSADTGIFCCFNSVEITDSVKMVGSWSFYAGYNVWDLVDPSTSAQFDSVASVSSDKDCTIILNGGTFVNFMLGSRRIAAVAPFGTYSGNMTAVIGKNVSFAGSPRYRSVMGHTYVTGTANVWVNSWPAGEEMKTFPLPGTMTGGITYNAAGHTGTVNISTEEAPAVTAAPPAVTTAVPAETTKAPVQVTTAPAATTVAPAETTKAPVETTVAPIETTKAPAKTTAASVETTKAPVQTVETPADTTAAPVTTTAPAAAAPAKGTNVGLLVGIAAVIAAAAAVAVIVIKKKK